MSSNFERYSKHTCQVAPKAVSHQLSMSTQATQELPPPGGYPEVKYRRYLPKRGPSGLVIFAGLTAICGYGFYRVAQGNLERR
jgi:hypothetical protein